MIPIVLTELEVFTYAAVKCVSLVLFNIWDFDALVEVEVLSLDTIELEAYGRVIISAFELLNGNTIEFVIPIVLTELEVLTYAAVK